jgi:hypothetical protein
MGSGAPISSAPTTPTHATTHTTLPAHSSAPATFVFTAPTPVTTAATAALAAHSAADAAHTAAESAARAATAADTAATGADAAARAASAADIATVTSGTGTGATGMSMLTSVSEPGMRAPALSMGEHTAPRVASTAMLSGVPDLAAVRRTYIGASIRPLVSETFTPSTDELARMYEDIRHGTASSRFSASLDRDRITMGRAFADPHFASADMSALKQGIVELAPVRSDAKTADVDSKYDTAPSTKPTVGGIDAAAQAALAHAIDSGDLNKVREVVAADPRAQINGAILCVAIRKGNLEIFDFLARSPQLVRDAQFNELIPTALESGNTHIADRIIDLSLQKITSDVIQYILRRNDTGALDWLKYSCSVTLGPDAAKFARDNKLDRAASWIENEINARRIRY